MKNLIFFFFSVYFWMGASSYCMEEPLHPHKFSVEHQEKKRENSPLYSDKAKRLKGINVEKKNIIEKAIKENELCIELISRNFSLDEKEKLDNDSQIKDYRHVIKELKELQSSNTFFSQSAQEIEHNVDNIQRKYFPEDDD